VHSFSDPTGAVGAVNKEIVVSEEPWFVQLHGIVSSDMHPLRAASAASSSAAPLTGWTPT